jgi:prepilin-type processing-associated H-X9-DG protein
MACPRACCALLAFLGWAATPPLSAGEKLPADLAFVPADGLAFIHVRLGDVWKSEHFKEWRDTILKAGERALAGFDQRFVPAPSSIDRLTVAVLRSEQPQREPDVVFILATTKPIDQDAFLERMAPGAQQRQAGGKAFYEVPKQKVGLHFAGAHTLVFGPAAAVERALQQPPARQGDLSEALKQAREGKPLVAAVNVAALASLLPPRALEQAPPPVQALAQARLATLTVDFGEENKIDLKLIYADAEQAAEAEQGAKAGVKMARAYLAQTRQQATAKVLGDGQPGTLEDLPEAAGALFGLGAINRLDEFLAVLPLKKEGAALHLSLRLPREYSSVVTVGAISSALLVPAVQKVRAAAVRTQDQNNLKQLVLALINHADSHRGNMTPAAICDKDGKPLLSWRVAILPYIEQDALYRQFKLDEPWDSDHNKKLISQMPGIYMTPAAPPRVGETHYRVFVGGGAAFDLTKPTRWPASFRDGTSNTLLIVQTADSVPWTKPDDLPYDEKKPLPKLGGFYAGGYNAAFADGSVRFLSVTVPEATLRALITRAGGEITPGLDR